MYVFHGLRVFATLPRGTHFWRRQRPAVIQNRSSQLLSMAHRVMWRQNTISANYCFYLGNCSTIRDCSRRMKGKSWEHWSCTHLQETHASLIRTKSTASSCLSFFSHLLPNFLPTTCSLIPFLRQYFVLLFFRCSPFLWGLYLLMLEPLDQLFPASCAPQQESVVCDPCR